MFDAYKVDRAALWAAMDAAGVTYALVEFSGGNDEGGADLVIVDGKECTDYQSELYNLLARLPHERYYSFAGDFEVHGTVMIDRADMMVTMSGSESTWAAFETGL